MRSLERIFVRTDRRTIAIMFVRLSVCLSGTDLHCDTVHIRADLSSRLDSPMFWAPWHQSMSTYSQPSFSSSTWKRGGIWMCKLGVISQERLKIEVKLILSVNRKSYIASSGTTTDDLDWPWMVVLRIARYLCGAELLVPVLLSLLLLHIC